MSKNRYTFTLLGINLEKVDQKYGINKVSSIPEDDIHPENTTKINDLEIIKKTPDVISFLDESKKVVKCFVSMIDFKSFRSIDGKNKYKCYWDKNYIPDNFQAIGCPIRYIPSRVTKTYHSEITKENYSISEPITEIRRNEIQESNDSRMKIETKAYYETDGIFCSFNCCMAHIEDPDNKNNPLYQYSESLLLKMYNELNEYELNDSISEIMSAPHWRTLSEFGGHQSIEQFRDSFNKVKYKYHGMISIGRLFEDNIQF
jgi:hypothetical protein